MKRFLILLFTFGFVQPVHAYLDPGTGSIVLQGIIAAIVAISVGVRIYWHRLLRLLGLRKDAEIDEND